MRQIKFRAWDGQKVFDWMEFKEDGGWVVPFTISKGANAVMQFTGLTDKNGKEIYEGDIVKDIHAQIHEIRWIKDEANLKAVFIDGFGNDQFRHFRDIQFMEVIGNIYENPELIKHDKTTTTIS